MQYSKEINPFFETYVYLVQRFAEERAEYRLEKLKEDHFNIPNNYWELYNGVTELEKSLDAEFDAGGLISEYFTPFKTKDVTIGRYAPSLGTILLHMPEDAPMPTSIDDLIAYYSKAGAESRFRHFGGMLKSYVENVSETHDLGGLVAAIDCIIASPEDKWTIIDAVTDPVRHLEKLRPIVNDITDRISAAAIGFSEMLDECYRLICSSNKKMMDRLIKIDDLLDYESVTVIPSIFYLNFYSKAVYENNKAIIMLGVFGYRIFIPKYDQVSEDRFVYMLKALSEVTRLRVLHSLCDEYSYGQKLAEQYNSTPNALYYHLDKLLSCGLVEIKETEYRTLYTMNKRAVYKNLTDLRDYLVNGWKPEDEPDADAETPETGGESGPEE